MTAEEILKAFNILKPDPSQRAMAEYLAACTEVEMKVHQKEEESKD